MDETADDKKKLEIAEKIIKSLQKENEALKYMKEKDEEKRKLRLEMAELKSCKVFGTPEKRSASNKDFEILNCM